jgi:hypothetical protein
MAGECPRVTKISVEAKTGTEQECAGGTPAGRRRYKGQGYGEREI